MIVGPSMETGIEISKENYLKLSSTHLKKELVEAKQRLTRIGS